MSDYLWIVTRLHEKYPKHLIQIGRVYLHTGIEFEEVERIDFINVVNEHNETVIKEEFQEEIELINYIKTLEL